MADYNVGNIEIGIKSSSLKALEGIDKTISKLQEFKKIDKELQNIFSSINKLTNGFSKLSKLNVNPLNNKITEISKSADLFVKSLSSLQQPNFSETATSLNKLTNAFRQLDKVKTFDFRQMYESFNRLTRIVDPFLQKLQASEKSLLAFSNILSQLKTSKITKINNELDKVDQNTRDIKTNIETTDISKLFNLGKIYFFINYTKRIVQFFGKMVSSAIDFNETLNKFQVSMGENYERSLEFVKDLTKAFNLAEESVMNYMSTFKNMLSALGNLSEDTSYVLSETLTRMALDYASLFNVEVTRAMEQFQAVLSGQIRSIRSVSGYDVSETTLYNIYKQLGGTKTMRQLDQVEKRLLRIIALQYQMQDTGAVGDFEKTINTTSNQLKQLSETLKEIGRWLGQYVMFIIKPLVQYTLSFAIALKEVLKYINIINGYEYEDFGEGGLFGEVEDSATSAENAVDSLKNKLLGFDTLNILGDTTATTDADYSFLLDQILSYQSPLDEVENTANNIAESILNWAGYSFDAEGNLQKTGNTLRTILAVIGSIVSILVSSKIFSWLSTASTTIMQLLKSMPTGLGYITLIVGAMVLLYNTNEDFKQSMNELLAILWDIVKVIGKIIGDVIGELMPSITSLLNSVAEILPTILNALLPIVSALGDIVTHIGPVIVVIAQVVAGLIENLAPIIVSIIQLIADILVKLTPIITSIIEVIGNFIKDLAPVLISVIQTIANIIQSIFPIVQTLVELIANILFPIISALVPIFEVIVGFIGDIAPLIILIAQTVANLLEDIGPVITDLIVMISDFVNQILPVIVAVVSVIAKIISSLAPIIKTIVDVIVNILAPVINALLPIFEIISSIILKLAPIIKLIVDLISITLAPVINALLPIIELIGTIVEAFAPILANIIDLVLNGLVGGIVKFINYFIKGINNLGEMLSGAWEWLGIPPLPALPTWQPIPLATGGVVTKPTNALVGEYKGASSNPEIVTPENLMREVFMESVLPIAQAIVSGNKEVVDAIEELAQRPVELNGRKVSENIYKDLKNVAARKGDLLFVK